MCATHKSCSCVQWIIAVAFKVGGPGVIPENRVHGRPEGPSGFEKGVDITLGVRAGLCVARFVHVIWFGVAGFWRGRSCLRRLEGISVAR